MLPIRPKRSVDLLTWIQPSNVNLLGSAPAASPFVPVDQQNPRSKPFPNALRGFLNPSEVHLIGLDQFFAAPGEAPRYDWPNPRSKPIPSVNRGFINPAEVHLIGKDTFFAAAGEAPRYDWPNPVLRKSRFAAMTSQPQNNLNETTFTTIAPSSSPFYFARYVTGRGR